MVRTQKFILLCMATLFVIGCSASKSGKIYTTSEALQLHSVEEATVITVEQVTIRKDGSIFGADGEQYGTVVGTTVGGAIGGIAGSSLGGGKGKQIATVVGVLLGGVLGHYAERGVTDKDALKLVVKLDSGDSYAIIQEADVTFSAGEKVYIVTNPADGIKRVTKK